MNAGEPTFDEAGANLCQVIDKSCELGPQTITRDGRRAAVVVSAEEWDRRTARKGTLVEFLNNSPLRGSGLRIEREKGSFRDVDL